MSRLFIKAVSRNGLGLFVFLGALFFLLLLYLLIKPSVLAPVAWDAPNNPGYYGPFEENDAIVLAHTMPTAGLIGPESVAVDAVGRLYTGLENGDILRAESHQHPFERWVNTGGRPLGLAFGADGALYVADAYRGLLKIDQQGEVVLLTDRVSGDDATVEAEIRYADDLDVSREGVIYFTDASTKYGAKAFKGTLQASILDLVEHGGYGRLLKYDPATEETTVVMSGLQFANGVALAEDDAFLVLVETGMYRVLKVWLKGPRAGQHEVLIDQLPGFPDNVTRGEAGRFWVAFPSPRNPLMDRFASRPILRKMMMNLPKRFHPKPVLYTHTVAINAEGDVVANMQSRDGVMPVNSSVVEWEGRLYLGSLASDFVGVTVLPSVLPNVLPGTVYFHH